MDFPDKIFIIGTDSGVGKTLVSAVLTFGLRGCYWKPIQCGVSPCTDTEWVHDTTGLSHTHFLKETFRFGNPISPHAQHTGITIADLKPHNIEHPHEHLIIEGTGGVMNPINEKQFYIDYIQETKIPTLLVVKNNKGAVNQAILTLEKLRERAIPVFGIVLNGNRDEINKRAIEEYCPVPYIFEIDIIDKITENALKDAFKVTFEPCEDFSLSM